MSKQLIAIVALCVVLLVVFVAAREPGANTPAPTTPTVTNFDECVAAGNPVMESYPRQCRSADGQLFVESVPEPEVPNEREISGSGNYEDMIRVTSPGANTVIGSPLSVSGSARGGWYFEATFPVILVDWDGRIIAETYAQAQGEWMTENYVPFTSTVTFEKPYEGSNAPEYMKWGTLILKRSNASGLPEHDAAIEIPIRFDE